MVGPLVTALLLLRMFVPSPVGLADQGDGARLTCQLGLRTSVPAGAAQYVKYAIFYYVPGSTPDTRFACLDPYPSSQLAVLRLARALTALTGQPGTLDLRWAAVVWCVLAGAAFAVLAATLAGSRGAVAALLAGLFVVTADAAFADYAASAYSEPAGFIGLLWCCAALAVLVRVRGRWRLAASWAGFCAAGIFTICYKQQGVTLAAPLAGIALAVALHASVRSGRRGRVGWRWLTTTLLVPVVAAGMFAGAAFALARQSSAVISQPNEFDVVFVGILGNSPDPRADLAALGADPALARYAGAGWWSPGSARTDPAYAAFAPKITRTHVALFLARHPMRALSLLNHGAKALFAARPGYLGSYPASAGHSPGARDCRLCIVSSVLPGLAGPLSLPLLLALLLAVGIFGWRTLREVQHPVFPRQLAAAGLISAGAVAVQLPTAVLGEGVETTKHLVLAVFALALAIAFTVAAAISRALTPPQAGLVGAQREHDESFAVLHSESRCGS